MSCKNSAEMHYFCILHADMIVHRKLLKLIHSNNIYLAPQLFSVHELKEQVASNISAGKNRPLPVGPTKLYPPEIIGLQ